MGELLAALNADGVNGWSGRVKVPAMISSEYENRGVTLLGVDPEGELGCLADRKSVV